MSIFLWCSPHSVRSLPRDAFHTQHRCSAISRLHLPSTNLCLVIIRFSSSSSILYKLYSNELYLLINRLILRLILRIQFSSVFFIFIILLFNFYLVSMIILRITSRTSKLDYLFDLRSSLISFRTRSNVVMVLFNINDLSDLSYFFVDLRKLDPLSSIQFVYLFFLSTQLGAFIIFLSYSYIYYLSWYIKL